MTKSLVKTSNGLLKGSGLKVDSKKIKSGGPYVIKFDKKQTKLLLQAFTKDELIGIIVNDTFRKNHEKSLKQK